MKALRYVFQLVLGLVFGFLCFIALAPALAAFTPGPESPPVAGLVVIGLVALFITLAPALRRAFGRGFLLTGVAVFALPLSTMLLSGRAFSDMSDASGGMNGAEAAGAAMGGVLATGLAGFVGFFFGAILLIIGLVLALGGRRDVRVVQ